MPESVQTTLEEARRCPTCGEAGVLINRRPAPRETGLPQNTMVEMNECRNNRCASYIPPEILPNGSAIPAERFRWAVQVNPDGTIPPKGALRSQPKAYDLPSPHSGVAQRARDLLAYQAELDLHPDGREATEIGRDLGYA